MQVRLLRKAQRDLNKLLQNLASYYSPATALRIAQVIDEKLASLVPFPFQYEEVRSKEFGLVRRMVVERNTIILYRVTRHSIVVIAIRDARTNWK